MNNMQYVLMIGNTTKTLTTERFTFFGPFASYSLAIAYRNKYHSKLKAGEWFMCRIHTPSDNDIEEQPSDAFEDSWYKGERD